MLTRRHIMKLAAAGVSLPSVSSTMAQATAQEPTADFDNAAGPNVLSDVVINWRYENTGIAYYPPQYVDGWLYIPTGSKVLVLNALTGEYQWDAFVIHDSATLNHIDQDVVVASSASRAGGSTHIFDAQTGSELWKVETQHTALMSSPLVEGTTLYISVDEDLVAFNLRTGTELWRAPGKGGNIAIDNHAIYTSTYDGHLRALNKSSASEKWSYHVEATAIHLEARGRSVFMLSGPDNQYLQEFDVHTGDWLSGTRFFTYTVESLYFYERLILLVRSSGICEAIDVSTGDLVWSWTAPEGSVSPSVIGQDTWYIGSGPQVYALDLATGTVKWQFHPGNENLFDHVVAADVLYVAGDHLYVLDALSGNEHWRYPLMITSMVHNTRMAVGGGQLYMNHDTGTYLAMGNLPPGRLVQDVTLRAAPAQSSIERGTAPAGTEIDRLGPTEGDWAEVTIGDVTGWIPVEAIDPATLAPQGDVEYVYQP